MLHLAHRARITRCVCVSLTLTSSYRRPRCWSRFITVLRVKHAANHAAASTSRVQR